MRTYIFVAIVLTVCQARPRTKHLLVETEDADEDEDNKEPYEGYTHRPHFLKQEEITQFAVKNSCPELTWNLYGFPMPQIGFRFEGKEIELGEKFTCVYR